jgi:putative ABC transport system permease protein
MISILKDLRYAIRGLVKRPGFAFVAVLTLALGIGANTAIFSVVNTVLLRPLKFANPERLVIVWEEASFAGFPRNTPAPANYVDWKTQNHSFEDMAAIDERNFNLTGDGNPEYVAAYGVSANFFPLLGVQPMLGRMFVSQEDTPEGSKVVILSHRLWQTRYGADQNIVGRDILINSEKYTVVGVMPAGFQFLESDVRLWVPIGFDQEELHNRGGHYLTVVARLKQGIDVAQAQADMQTLMASISKDHANETFNGKLGAVVVPLSEQLTGDSRRPLMVLLIAVSFVLLIACANIASLMLSRAASRRREIAVRTALGASRTHIVRQLLTESLLLALTGGLVGLVLASFSFYFLRQLIPPGMILSSDLRPDLRMLLFAMVVSVLTAIIFGLFPALQAAKFDLNEALKQAGGRGNVGGASRLRQIMVVGEVALSLMLLIGAGLLIQTLFQLHNQYSVLEPEKILTLRTQLPRRTYTEQGQRTAFYRQVLERVQHLPGVVAAGYSTSVPLSWKGGTNGFYPEGTGEPLPGLSYDANHRQVSADYLKAMQIPLRQGRYFDEHDSGQSAPVAIINETMSRQYWPTGDAVGRRFKLGDPNEETPWYTIVGIVADVRQMGLDVPVKAEMYLPHEQVKDQPWFAPRDLAIRTTGEPMALVSMVRDVVRSVDPNQPISNVATMEELLGEETAQRRVGMVLLSTFAALASLLAALGIYGLLAYFVVQHTNEIGVRLALGATPGRIVGLVVTKGMSLTLFGIGLGLAASFALTRLMASLLFGVKAIDVYTFAAVPVLLAGVALLACWIPARRASKTDPLVALRAE